MGNTACCENPADGQRGEVIVPTVEEPPKIEKIQNNIKQPQADPDRIPDLLEPVKQNLEKYKPFHDKLTGELKTKRFNNLLYHGQMNEKEQPHGYGKMYYPNGSVFVGSFQEGLANGEGHYVFFDGSYYMGKMKDNKADDSSGIFQAEGLKYSGSIKNNQLNGFGKQQGENYTYEGHFQNGKIKLGKLAWTQKETKKLPLSQDELYEIVDWSYEGNFDEEGNFDGKGVLIGPKGKFTGDFKKGTKHGQGTYQFVNKLKYEGSYQNGMKNGQGTLYSADGKIAYSGQFSNGLPHGKGWIPLPDGSKNYLQFNEGISCLLSEKE